MLVKTTLLAAALIASQFQPSAAWWDNGHMLVGEVASQLLEAQDRETLETVLTKWERQFPNTNRVATAAIWPDLIKCSKSSPFCATPALPSVSVMDDWHYMNLPANLDGSKWGGKDADLDMFKASFGGHAIEVLEKAVKTFGTTQSVWAANFMLRNLIHVVGDVHLPVHTIGGVSDRFPTGDAGGNMEAFVSPCPSSNLHAVWDAAGGLYTNNWAPQLPYEDQLRANATELVELSKTIVDPLNMEGLAALPYAAFSKEMIDNSMLKKMILDTYKLAEGGLYTKLDLTFNADKKLPCPSAEYYEYVQKTSKNQIALAGRRLAVILKQFAAQIRTLKIPMTSDRPPYKPTQRPADKPKPTLNPNRPTKDPVKPTQDPTKPTQNPGKPTQNPGIPTQNPGKPTQNPGTPTLRPATDMPTQLPASDKPTQQPSAGPSDKPTQNPGAPSQQPGSDKPTQQPTSDKPTQQPAGGKTTEQPTSSKTTDKPAQLPSGTTTDKLSVDKPTQPPAGGKTTEQPAGKPDQKPATGGQPPSADNNKPTQQPVGKTTDKPSTDNKPTQKPAQPSTDNKPTQKPAADQQPSSSDNNKPSPTDNKSNNKSSC